ncbi:MAG: gluconokinase [Verrucomicrobiota bacterium]
MRLFVVMGVAGCGKSTFAEALAQASGGRYLDADAFHPESNKKKMASGIPLDDEDREGWLILLNDMIREHRDQNPEPLFLACSALKKSYRDILKKGVKELRFLFLNGSFELIRERMEARSDHFMPVELLESQFEALEEPENAIWFDIIDPPERMLERFFNQYPEMVKSS